jgi:hypothetical protein
MKRADRAIITSGLIVAVSSAGLAAVRGYGTVLFQLVVLGAWSIVARLSSGMFADRHQGIVWLVILVVNVSIFSLIGIPVWLLSRNRLPKWGTLIIVCWTIFYMAMLFILFPATDGP